MIQYFLLILAIINLIFINSVLLIIFYFCKKLLSNIKYFHKNDFQGIHYFKIFSIKCSYGFITTYTGSGYDQGIGFDLNSRILEIGRLQLLSNLKFSTNGFWLDDLKKKLK